MELNTPADAPLQRHMRFTVPAADVEAHYKESLRHKAKHARLPGFRPGKVPMPVVERQFGRDALLEAFDELINEHYANALRSHELRPVARPEVNVEQGAPGQDLIFTAVVEVYPEFTPQTPSALLTRKVVEITDEDVERTLTVMRQQRQDYVSVARAAQSQDRVLIDFVGKIDGEPFAGGSMDDYPVLIGAGRLLPEMENALVGMSAGEEKRIAVPFPVDYPVAELVGKTADFLVRMKDVAEPRLPELDSEFARSLGIEDGDVATLREEVRANLQREAERLSRQQLKAALLQEVLVVNSFEVPKALLAQEAERQKQGREGELSAEQYAEVEKRVRLGLILSELARQQQLRAASAKMEQALAEMAEQYEDPREFMAWYRKDRERMENLESMVLEDAVVDWLLERVTVEEQKIGFQDLIGARAATGSEG
ncbi:trigger factor [Acidithiobacillus sp. AMEEHan]|uniref:trigger factor n=1 Tax=Acidithiobacillus sp. AMEEHan TaxID=2994951 RepID=UPI0027E5AEA3|nr:trigger factor [Acidithiobacillus sp. AMEEHan]